MSDPQWLDWAKRLQAIARTGLTYAQDVYDIERHHSIQKIAAEMLAAGSDTQDIAPIRGKTKAILTGWYNIAFKFLRTLPAPAA